MLLQGAVASVFVIIGPLLIGILLVHHLKVDVVLNGDPVGCLGDAPPSVEEFSLRLSALLDFNRHSLYSLISVRGNFPRFSARVIMLLEN